MHTPSHTLLFAAAALLAAPSTAQERVESPRPEPIQLDVDLTPAEELALSEGRAAAGLAEALRPTPRNHWLAGAPVTAGLDLKATYGPEGVTVTPVLGRAAPHTRTLRWSLSGIEVGGRPLVGLDLTAEPTLVDGTVTYARGAGVTEFYDVLPEGLEQSFLIESLPARDGELVVRGRFGTDLLALDGAAPSLRFREPGIADLRVHSVVAIDADGDRFEGSLRLGPGTLEIVLPAAAVAVADEPLLVDPLFSVEYAATDGSFDADQADIAFGASSFDEYALVHCRYYSSTDPDIWARTYNSSGGVGLSTVIVESTIGTFDQEPAIAYNVPNQTFAVAWQRASAPGATNDVLIASFDAASGTVSSTAIVAGGLADQRRPDIGGEEIDNPTYDNVVVVYESDATIQVTALDVTAGTTPTIVATNAIPSMSSAHRRPAITKSGGSSGRYFVAAEQDFGTDRDLDLAIVNDFGAVLLGTASITSIGPDEERPDIAGDGAEGLLVYEREDTAGDGDNDVVARKLTYDGVAGAIVFEPVELLVASDSPDDEFEPAVGLIGNEYLVAWSDETGSEYDVYARTVGADNCKLCEPQQTVATLASNREPEVASRPSGGDPDTGEAAVAWTRDNPGNDQVLWRLWKDQGAGSTLVNVGGGCGGGGAISFFGPTGIGTTELTVRLTGADPFATLAVLNINAPGVNTVCGPCSITAPFLLFDAPTVPGPFGTREAELPLPIPCDGNLAGKTLSFQWYVLPTGPSPCPLVPQVSFSPEIQMTFGH